LLIRLVPSDNSSPSLSTSLFKHFRQLFGVPLFSTPAECRSGDRFNYDDAAAWEGSTMNTSDRVVPFARAVSSPKDEWWWHSDLLEHTHDAVIVWEMGGRGVIFWNRAAEMLYGYPREEAHGRITHELLRTELMGDIAELEGAIARHGLWSGELRHTTRSGRRILVQARLVLLPRLDDRWLVAEFNREIGDAG
jgi:PAS domain S-box-containing protein